MHEFAGTKTMNFDLFVDGSEFTDDSVLTIAVADWILTGEPLAEKLASYARRYPGRGYGGRFATWIHSEELAPYDSFGNGSAMRASPAGFAAHSEEEALDLGERSAAVTHNHPEGIRGARATALAVFLAKNGAGKTEIRDAMESRIGYDLSRPLDEIRPEYRFTELCLQTVPPALVAFLESEDYEDAVRKAISLGGDADTLAAITGGIAEAFYGGVPSEIATEARRRLDPELITVLDRFRERFGLP